MTRKNKNGKHEHPEQHKNATQHGQISHNMNSNDSSPPKQGYIPAPNPPNLTNVDSNTGSADILRQSMDVLYGQYGIQQTNFPLQPNTTHTNTACNMPNVVNTSNINNNIPSFGTCQTNQTQQCVQSRQEPQLMQHAQSQNQSQQQNVQQNIGVVDCQQQLPGNSDVNTAPLWATNMLQNLGQQLQTIQNQLMGQNQRWQAIESKIENQNMRMTSMETQINQLTSFKQTLVQNAKKVETLTVDMKSIQTKMNEYDKCIQSYSDICDGITSSNSETESQLNYLMTKVGSLEEVQNQLETKQSETEEKIIDVQWRTMRENLIFSGIPESDVRRGEQEDCEALIKEFLRSEMNITTDILFDRVHRLGKFKQNQLYPRPVIAKFTNYKDKEHVRRCAPRTLIGTPYRINEQFPTEIENRRKMLYPEAKRARQNKNNEVKLVRDKLYINGKQFIPTQTYIPQNNVSSKSSTRPNRGFQSNFEQRNTNRQQPLNSQYRHQDSERQHISQSQRTWQQERSNIQRNNITHRAPWHGARKFVSQREEREISTFNRFEPFTNEQINDTPQRAGKKKATSPVDIDVTMKKQRECDLDITQNTTNFLLDAEDTSTNDANVHILPPRNLSDIGPPISPLHEKPVELRMPTPVNSAELYYGPPILQNPNNTVHSENTDSLSSSQVTSVNGERIDDA